MTVLKQRDERRQIPARCEAADLSVKPRQFAAADILLDIVFGWRLEH